MTPAARDSTSRARAAASRYLSLLVELEKATDTVLSAAASGDAGRTGKLADVRWELCRKAGQAARELDSLISAQAGDAGSPNPADGADLRAAIEEIHGRERSVMQKQAECESVLAAEVHKCKMALVALNQRRDLQEAYSDRGPRQDARFLDSKL